jgi:hypothetical protein
MTMNVELLVFAVCFLCRGQLLFYDCIASFRFDASLSPQSCMPPCVDLDPICAFWRIHEYELVTHELHASNSGLPVDYQ